MNGERVGEWGTLRGAVTPFFRYEESWANSPHGRALSLSLPVTVNREVRGPAVEYYFDNLLPDSAELRSRIRSRFKTRSSDAFDLLMAIGRDCVGAVPTSHGGRVVSTAARHADYPHFEAPSDSVENARLRHRQPLRVPIGLQAVGVPPFAL